MSLTILFSLYNQVILGNKTTHVQMKDNFLSEPVKFIIKKGLARFDESFD